MNPGFRAAGLRHHQIGLERLVSVERELVGLLVDSRGLHPAEIREVRFELVLDGCEQGLPARLDVGCPERGEHFGVVVQAEAGRASRGVSGAVLVQVDTLLQRKQGAQTHGRVRRGIERLQRLLREMQLAGMVEPRDQHAGSPHADDGQREHREHGDGVPADASARLSAGGFSEVSPKRRIGMTWGVANAVGLGWIRGEERATDRRMSLLLRDPGDPSGQWPAMRVEARRQLRHITVMAVAAQLRDAAVSELVTQGQQRSLDGVGVPPHPGIRSRSPA